MDLDQKEIIISEEIKPFWKILIAAILFTVSLYFIYLTFYYWSMRWVYYGIRCFEFSLTLFLGASFFAARKIIYLNTEAKILKIEYRLGNIKMNFFKISNLEYISVFKDNQNEWFEVNLWYNKNKHLNISNFDNFDTALEYGKKFARKIEIDLLDATEKGNFKWIEK